MSLPVPAIGVLLVLLVILAAIMDVKNRKIPNWLTLPSAVLGVGLNAFLFEWSGLRESLQGLALAFVVYFVLYLLRGMGAGDVKLMAAVGAAVGPVNWFGILVLTSAFAAICGLVVVASKGRVRQTFQNLW